MPNDTIFKLNPFQLVDWTEEEVIEQYTIMSDSISGNDTPMELANDIDLYANCNYLMGEMVARYGEIVANEKAILDSNIANEIYRERDQWLKEKADKPPAMAYFESKALSKYIKEQIMLNQKEASLKRFKIAYESIQDKMNALKKKMESIGIETYGR